jgi:hypothetical protein
MSRVEGARAEREGLNSGSHTSEKEVERCVESGKRRERTPEKPRKRLLCRAAGRVETEGLAGVRSMRKRSFRGHRKPQTETAWNCSKRC